MARHQHRGPDRSRARRGNPAALSRGRGRRGTKDVGHAGHPDATGAVANGEEREAVALRRPRRKPLDAANAREPGTCDPVTRAGRQLRDPEIAVAVVALAIRDVGDALAVGRDSALLLVVCVSRCR